eukprot:1391471-Pleurochrysis_carterae.AAC.1
MPRKYQKSTAKYPKVTGHSELASELCHKLRRFSAFWRSISVAAGAHASHNLSLIVDNMEMATGRTRYDRQIARDEDLAAPAGGSDN